MTAKAGLLAGSIGAGKTTVAERVAGLARRQGLTVAGLLAPAMRNACGQKVGIWGVDLASKSGERHTLARTDRELGGPRLGAYSFDPAGLEWMVQTVGQAIDAVRRHPWDLLIVDEIGKLELWCDSGLAPILPRLAAGEVHRCLLLVRDSLLPELQSRLNRVQQVVFEVQERNREYLPARILEWSIDEQTKGDG